MAALVAEKKSPIRRCEDWMGRSTLVPVVLACKLGVHHALGG